MEQLNVNSSNQPVADSQLIPPPEQDARTRPNYNETTEGSVLLDRNMYRSISSWKLAFRNRDLKVDILAMIFGLGAWVGVTSVFLQLPLIVDKAPEGWSLPSYLTVIVQMANIGPLTYTMLQKFSPGTIKDSTMINFVKIIGVVASLLGVFFYQKTAVIGSQTYSVGLFIMIFLLALVGCTSSVLFMPYMGRFREIYLITYLIGEGLSGFLASGVALVQGVGGNSECIPTNTTNGTSYVLYTPPPRFSTSEFFFFVFSVILMSWIAFVLLHKLKFCKKEYAAVTIAEGNNYVYNTERGQDHNDSAVAETLKYISQKNYRFLMFVMATVSFFGNGILPSIQSFSSMPYGNLAYHLTVTMSAIANPFACFLAVFLPHSSIRATLSLAGLALVLAVYTLTTAALSPYPPLLDSLWGEAIVVTSWTFLMGLVSYTKLCITSVMRSQGGKSLVCVGAISQAGSAVGSVVIFILINVVNIFTSYEACSNFNKNSTLLME